VIQFIFMLFLLSPVGGLQVLPAIGMWYYATKLHWSGYCRRKKLPSLDKFPVFLGTRWLITAFFSFCDVAPCSLVWEWLCRYPKDGNARIFWNFSIQLPDYAVLHCDARWWHLKLETDLICVVLDGFYFLIHMLQ
jgi:hypothetical protein